MTDRFDTELATTLAGRYEVGAEIGRGGSSVVFHGRRVSDQAAVAIKVLRPEVVGGLLAERFVREIEIESRLSHASIMPVLEAGTTGDAPFLVLPFAEGGSLSTRLERQGELPVEDALAIAHDIASALACAHAAGIVHRDVKPGNILLADGRAYLVDFGVARILSELSGDRLTESGIALGTPAYMSPEQGAGDRKLDGRSDQYSLACVLHEMLVGDPPFTGQSTRAIAARHARETPPSVRIVRPNLSASVEYALLRAMAKSPADRFASVEDFARALGDPPPADWISPTDAAAVHSHRQRQRIWGFVGAAVLVALALWRNFPSAPAPDANKVVLFPLADSRPVQAGTNPGWSVALAISASLEHAVPLRGLDGWAYLDTFIRADARRLTAAMASRVARGRGARYYVVGAIAQVDTNASVTLQLFDATADTLVAQESAKSPLDEVSVVQGGLRAAALLLPHILDPGRTIDVAYLAGRNKSAIALWLQGERAYRQADFAGALALHQRALSEDSSFALAALRGAQAASWEANPDLAVRLVAVAVANDSLLPPGSAALARGFDAYLHGDAETAVRWLRQSVQQTPTAAEPVVLLGEAYHHLIRAGGDDSMALEEFREATRRDTLFSTPYVHLAEAAIRAGSVRDADRYVTALRRGRADSTFVRQLEDMRGCVFSRRFDWTTAARANLTAVVQASHELAAAGQQPSCAEGAFRAAFEAPDVPAAFRWHSLLGLTGLLVAEGRGAEARKLLDAEINAGRTNVMLLYAPAAIAGAPMADKSTEIEQYAASKYGDGYERGSALSRWAMALSHAQHGDRAMVRRLAASLRRLADSTRERRDGLIADAVAAHAALAEGDSTAAVARFSALRPSARGQTLVSDVFESLAVERIVLAQLLLRRGQPAEAMRVAETFDNAQPVMHLLYVAESLRIREEAARQLGRSRDLDRARNRLRALQEAARRNSP